MDIERISILGVRLSDVTYRSLLDYIAGKIETGSRCTIAYANANLLNYTYRKEYLRDSINSFDIVHPDGIGVYKASKILYGKRGFRQRFTGSDFYPELAAAAIKEKWRIFFFGHEAATLEMIRSNYPELIFAGAHEGFVFTDQDVIKAINDSHAQVLIIGLGYGKQEEWLKKNAQKLNVNAAIIVGDGIKVFAGVKLRGPKFLRAVGMEWFVRFLRNPFKYWKRYIWGNPLFLYRIFRDKMAKL